jgi:hypothetical protein
VLSPVLLPEAVPATAAAAAAPPPKTREDLEWVVAGVRALESETDNDTVTEAESETDRVSAAGTPDSRALPFGLSSALEPGKLFNNNRQS